MSAGLWLMRQTHAPRRSSLSFKVMGKQFRSKDFSLYFLSTKILTTKPQN